MYLTESDVRRILTVIDRCFPHAQVIMETMNPWVAVHMKEKSIDATTAKFTWGLKSGRELERLAMGEGCQSGGGDEKNYACVLSVRLDTCCEKYIQ